MNSTAWKKSLRLSCTHFARRAAADAVELPSKTQKKGHCQLLPGHRLADLIVITTRNILMPERSRASTSSDRLRCFSRGGSNWWLGIRISFVKYDDIFLFFTFLSSCGSLRSNNAEQKCLFISLVCQFLMNHSSMESYAYLFNHFISRRAGDLNTQYF